MRNIANEIVKTRVPVHTLAIWWLGQESVIVKGDDKVVGFDLYLSEYGTSPDRLMRAFPPLLNPEHLSCADVVFCSHEHLDHLDPWTLPKIAAASQNVQFVMPRVIVPLAVEAGVDKELIYGSVADQPFTVQGIEVYPLKAAHEVFDAESQGHRYQGYVIDLNGVRLAHLGDTVMYDGLVDKLRELQVDVLMAPINGRDYFRNSRDIAGNLDAREAAELAAVTGAKLVIPMHYDLFPGNQEAPGRFVEYLYQNYPEQPSKVMARGERFIYMKVEE